MSFIETPRFPDEVSAWMVGGEEFLTDVVLNRGGYEQRNQVWTVPLRRYSVQNALREIRHVSATKAFFRAIGGMANGFRVKDIFDYNATSTEGLLGTGGLGTGLPTYQLYKNYVSGSITSQGKIVKPISSSMTLYRNATPVTAGASPGNYSLDSTTGIVTYVADSQATVSNLSVGANTVVTLSANLPGITAVAGSNKLYLSGMTGANASILNSLAHTVISVSGANSNVYTLSTVTTGKTINVSGSGYKYPQVNDVLRWAGEYDIPVRFGSDWLQVGLDPGGLINWDGVVLQEIRL